ncbi:MAG: sulfatase, partial [Chthoniobacteraceae bacterium]|nr:sulfatase [Chthoniobacteraceae bacterium]
MRTILTVFIGLVLAPLAGLRAAERRPNILHILADDMGWTALSCFGNTDVSTPNLDRLAKQGMRFTNAYADAQCSPTRAAFLSGQYGARSGVFKVIHEQEPPKAFMRIPTPNLAMSPDVATLASSLRKLGYTTGLSGKWHIANNYAAAALRDHDGGKYFDRYGFDFCGEANEKDHADDKAVTAITDDIMGFIKRSEGKPWFAYAAHFTTHTKLVAPRALVEKHAARGYTRSSAVNGKYSERPTAEYLAMLEHFDNEVGRLLAFLDELRIADNTVVIFTSDNGGMGRVASNAPLREAKGSPYEGGSRVPLILRWPGRVKPDSQCDVPVHAVDYYPTYAEIAGGTTPAGHKIDGLSVLPLLTQGGTIARDTLAWHMPSYTAMYGRTPCAVIRKGDWKLIHWFGDYL